MNTTEIINKFGNPETRSTILLAVVAFHGPLLLGLSSRRRRSGNPVLRSMLWGVSAAYFPLMTYVLSYLTTFLRSAGGVEATGVLSLVIFVQFLRAKVDMAALAVAAVASPAEGENDGSSLKIRPSTESLINTFWVAALVLYNIFTKAKEDLLLVGVTVLMSPLWALGACRTVLRFVAFQRATSSFALGRNVELIDGYMVQLREEGGWFADSEMAAAAQQRPAVPRLIVTGERKQDVVKRPLGYHVKRSSLQGGRGSRLITLDRVWSSDSGHLRPEDKDLCLSFALFKCLRRRFAGYRLAVEAGSSWAFRFVCDGLLLGRGENEDDDRERVFRVIATELSFARDFFHKPLPVASLGTTAAALHFLLSLIIFPCLFLLALGLLLYYVAMAVFAVAELGSFPGYPLVFLALVLAMVNAGTEISEMVAGVRSNWTKISIIGHLVRSRRHCARRFLACLLKCKAPKFWDDEIRQTPDLFVVLVQQPAGACACTCCRRFFRGRRQLLCCLGRCRRRNHSGHDHNKDTTIKVPLVVKKAILKSLRGGGGKLSDGTAAIRRHADAFAPGNDVTWACRDGGGVVTTTDAILVWHIATTLLDMKRRSSSASSSSSTTAPSRSTPVANDGDDGDSKVVVACCLSRYCMYLVAEAPDLLPDKPFWITHRYEAVKKCIDEAPKCSGGGEPGRLYQHLVDTFSGGDGGGDGDGENSHSSHEVLIKGVRLGKQLAEEAEIRRQRSQGGEGARAAEAGEDDEVWEMLSEFWSEMLLYLAPSDNVKAHIEALQRGGELITLLWALLLHAGITSRPVEFNFTASVLLPTGDPDAIAVHNC